MKYALALAFASAVSAGVVHGGKNETVSYTTEVVTQYTTYCPEPTTITDGDNVITVTEPTIVTITHCPGGCTIEKPCTTTSAVVCDKDCPEPTEPAYPTYHPPSNATATYKPTGSVEESSPKPTEPITAGAVKVAGAGLAAFVGLAAFAL